MANFILKVAKWVRVNNKQSKMITQGKKRLFLKIFLSTLLYNMHAIRGIVTPNLNNSDFDGDLR